MSLGYNAVKFRYNANYTINGNMKFNEVQIERVNTECYERKLFSTTLGVDEYHKTHIMHVSKLGSKWRDVYNVKLEKRFDYVSGDSIGMICPNSDELVNEIMKMLEIDDFVCKIVREGSEAFNYVGSVREFFKHHFDFSGHPKRSFMLRLSALCDTEENKKYVEYLCSNQGANDYLRMSSQWNNVIDFLKTFGIKPELGELIGECGLVKPRYFSLINKNGSDSEILVGITSKQFDSFMRYGHVSDYLINLNGVGEVEVNLRRNLLFRLSSETKKIMAICTGTGVAPFISFAKNFKAHQSIWIVYGFRDEEDDIYKEMANNEEVVCENKVKISKVMSSRGIYVTDYLKANMNDIKEYVDSECIIYVCGRMDMQREVFEIFKNEIPKTVEDKRVVFDQWR
ncbi:NADPH cytochrome p450 reductase [Ordospora colligata]|uniref:NADPH--hemoprotein reductase n=1 Tax=Ordospora colligata OC4 TaxID=1354746 RepID=A0A0B2UIV3_9MICR|nr:NADPH cytochrome p450 reductase [Ordospora colligata OC4]KHN68987.1 NADPH cytochrome p450 reductase [Ordospora colligata OC4]TBU14215.1 NADPH cytochrome p450 reductase [Ordospora colligata]TBU14262.1 NADPH cytochrome p450 reductase [Ordospora colligata]TBU17892.1 NADPH cytochrome p450 reductase [Ordospora colligata]